jgi:hypothetical protein
VLEPLGPSLTRLPFCLPLMRAAPCPEPMGSFLDEARGGLVAAVFIGAVQCLWLLVLLAYACTTCLNTADLYVAARGAPLLIIQLLLTAYISTAIGKPRLGRISNRGLFPLLPPRTCLTSSGGLRATSTAADSPW